MKKTLFLPILLLASSMASIAMLHANEEVPSKPLPETPDTVEQPQETQNKTVNLITIKLRNGLIVHNANTTDESHYYRYDRTQTDYIAPFLFGGAVSIALAITASQFQEKPPCHLSMSLGQAGFWLGISTGTIKAYMNYRNTGNLFKKIEKTHHIYIVNSAPDLDTMESANGYTTVDVFSPAYAQPSRVNGKNLRPISDSPQEKLDRTINELMKAETEVQGLFENA